MTARYRNFPDLPRLRCRSLPRKQNMGAVEGNLRVRRRPEIRYQRAGNSSCNELQSCAIGETIASFYPGMRIITRSLGEHNHNRLVLIHRSALQTRAAKAIAMNEIRVLVVLARGRAARSSRRSNMAANLASELPFFVVRH